MTEGERDFFLSDFTLEIKVGYFSFFKALQIVIVTIKRVKWSNGI